MHRVVPSQVVDLIDQLFPHARTEDRFPLPPGTQDYLEATVTFAKQIPSELVILTGQELANYFVALSIIDSTLRRSMVSGLHFQLAEYQGKNPISLLRRALTKCPDAAPSPTTAELLFIADIRAERPVRS
jgi:hypothetical protein